MGVRTFGPLILLRCSHAALMDSGPSRGPPEGAHLLLQVRTRTLNGDLAATFRAWYPAFTLDDHPAPVEELPAAA